MPAFALFAAALAAQMPAPFIPERDCDYAVTPDGIVYHDPSYIFFDWDSSAITPAAAAVLDNVASAFGPLWERCGVDIVANADRSGSEAYNMALSRRRAAAILFYLRTRGVAAEAKLRGLGETGAWVETPDGVREPQNRWAMIDVLLPSRR